MMMLSLSSPVACARLCIVAGCVQCRLCLAKAEALAALPDGEEQALPQLVDVGVLGEVQLVEAGVRAAQPLPAAVRPPVGLRVGLKGQG